MKVWSCELGMRIKILQIFTPTDTDTDTKMMRIIEGLSSPLNCVALSQDDSYIILGDDGGTIIVQSTKTDD